MPRLAFISSTRVRMLILMFVVAAALVGVTVYFALDQQRADEARAKEELTRSSQLIAQNQHQRYDNTESFLTTLAESPALLQAAGSPSSLAARTACFERLGTTASSLPGALGLGLFDAAGERICSSTTSDRGGTPAVDRLDFQTALATRRFAIGEVFEARTDPPRRTMAVAAPVLGPRGDVIAVLRLGAELGESTQLPPPANVPDEAEISVIDRNGVVINSSQEEFGRAFAGIDPADLRGMGFLETKLVADDTDGVDREHVITRVTDDDATPIYTVLSVPPGLLTTPLLDALIPEVVLVLAVALATLLAAWLLGDVLIARPARALAAAARRIRSGDFSDPVGLALDEGELGQVGIAFNDMTRQLRSQVEQLQRALSAKDEFLSLVSHELRTPVTTILGNAHVLAARWAELDEEIRASALADMQEDAQRLTTIIENLLVLARLESGRSLDIEPMVLRRIVVKVVDAHRQKHPHRTYHLSAPAELVVVEGNEQFVEQIIANLLSNAEKYSPPDAAVAVRIWRDGGDLAIAVEDAGIGIDPAEAEQLFSPFYRSAKTAQVAGLGVGLSVCQRLVEAQGGRIWASAREGGGSTFVFTLPVADVAHDVDGDAPFEETGAPPDLPAATPAL